MMKILKFGGSSVADAHRIQNVLNILAEELKKNPSFLVVVSAFGGVTDELLRISTQAFKGDSLYTEKLKQLKQRHLDVVHTLLSSDDIPAVLAVLEKNFQELADALHGVMLLHEVSKRTQDLILSFGERLSAYIISQAAKKLIPHVYYLDARQLIKTDAAFGEARVNYAKTNENITAFFKKHSGIPIITGFISSTDNEETTTLGRGGSDFTASIFGAALNADAIEIWTDVDGVMTADPRKVSNAFTMPQITYKEALEMSHFGAKVIHPPTISPAMQKNIPLVIKNSFNPKAPGTFISNKKYEHEKIICGISSIDKVALLRLEGSGIIGVCGTAMRLFGSLAKNEINVIMITQGSSEHSICLAINPLHVEKARKAVDEEFTLERHNNLMENAIIEENMSIVAVVGENMRKTKGISGKLFSCLGNHEINIVAIAQGSSEYNITLVVDNNDLSKTLNVIHREFFQ